MNNSQNFILGNSTEDLIASEKEVKQIASLLNEQPKLMTEVTFLESLRQASIIHFTGHGFFGSSKSMETFGLNMSAEEVVTASDILMQENNCKIVVLSACDTLKHVPYEDEERAGLISSLLTPGVNSVLANK